MKAVATLAAVAAAVPLLGSPAQADSLRECQQDTDAARSYSVFCGKFDVYRGRENGELSARLIGRVGPTGAYDLIVSPSTYLTASRKREFGGIFGGRRIAFSTRATLGDRLDRPYTDRIVARGRWGKKAFTCRAAVRNEGRYSTRSDLCTLTTMVPLMGVYYFTFS